MSSPFQPQPEEPQDETPKIIGYAIINDEGEKNNFKTLYFPVEKVAEIQDNLNNLNKSSIKFKELIVCALYDNGKIDYEVVGKDTLKLKFSAPNELPEQRDLITVEKHTINGKITEAEATLLLEIGIGIPQEDEILLNKYKISDENDAYYGFHKCSKEFIHQQYRQQQGIMGYAVVSDLPGEAPMYFPVEKGNELQSYLNGRGENYLGNSKVVALYYDQSLFKTRVACVEANEYEPEYSFQPLPERNNLRIYTLKIFAEGRCTSTSIDPTTPQFKYVSKTICFMHNKDDNTILGAAHNFNSMGLEEIYNEQQRFLNQCWKKTKDIWHDNPWIKTTIITLGSIALAATGLFLGYKFLQSRKMLPESLENMVSKILPSYSNSITKNHVIELTKSMVNSLPSLGK